MVRDLRKLQESQLEKAEARALQEAERATGGRFPVAQIDWEAPDLSIRKMREAVSESAFPALMRVGVQNFLFDGYRQPEVVYPELVRVVNSTKRQELYAPLYQTELPEEVLPGEAFQESNIAGLDMQLVNKKWGRLLSFERELVDDDQTNQIIERATTMGQRMRQREEIEAIGALFGDYLADGTTQAYTTAIGNRPNTFGPLKQQSLEEADLALEQMRDPLGNLMLVNATTLVHSTADKFNVATLLNSTYWASVPDGSAVGATGTNFASNPLAGLYKPVRSRYVPVKGADNTSGAWILMEPKRGLVFQDRDPLEVLQENPASGDAFEYDAYRYRVRRRFVVGHIESRFAFRGN